MSTPPPPQHPYGDPHGDPHGAPYGEPPAQPPYPYEQQQPYPQQEAGYGYPAQDPYGNQQPPQPYGGQAYGEQAYGGQAPYGGPYAEQAPAPYGAQPYPAPDAYGNWPQSAQPGYGAPEPAPQPAPYATPYGTPEPPPAAQETPNPQAPAPQTQAPQPPGPASSSGPRPSYGTAYDSLYGPGAAPGAATTAVPAFGDPAPAPPRKSRRTLFLGIGAGAAVLVVVGALLAFRGGGGDSDPDAGFPQVHQRLAPPAALLDGAYTRDQDLSQNEGAKINTEARGARDVRDASAVVVTYVGEPADGGGGSLVVSGFNGRIRNPGDTRAAMLKGAAGAKGAELLAPAKSFGGAEGAAKGNGAVSCQTMSTTQGSVTVVFPMCAWADDNTAATVAEITPKSVAAKAADVDLAAAAKRVAQVRAEMTKPYCPGGKGVC
ncbi:hypothetical protein [Streptomyces sp. GZWMJZ-114]|uniref:hypothetical protein n=1 Tax=Streptomyces sp. GZWMJZ-114 TaxID=2494734 RepID=UPI001F513D3F|nr:hypothetical protein [Streptomyces sp. GZWMJZ-114]